MQKQKKTKLLRKYFMSDMQKNDSARVTHMDFAIFSVAMRCHDVQ